MSFCVLNLVFLREDIVYEVEKGYLGPWCIIDFSVKGMNNVKLGFHRGGGVNLEIPDLSVIMSLSLLLYPLKCYVCIIVDLSSIQFVSNFNNRKIGIESHHMCTHCNCCLYVYMYLYNML